MASLHPPGTAPVKAEYIISVHNEAIPDDDAAEGNTNQVTGGRSTTDTRDGEDTPDGAGSRKLSGAQRKKLAKEEKKKQRGQNKGRRFQKVKDEVELCWRVAKGEYCEFGSECRFTHDIPQYLAAKPRDIKFPSLSELSNCPPFINQEIEEDGKELHSIDLTTSCPVFTETGSCQHGFKCRFLGAHVRKTATEPESFELVKDADKQAQSALTSTELNFVDAEVKKALQKRKYPRPITDAYLKELEKTAEANRDANGSTKQVEKSQPAESDSVIVVNVSTLEDTPMEDLKIETTRVREAAEEEKSQYDTPDVPTRPSEKKRLYWSGKTYLAPLTTVGNLPFRRLCVSLGADITCGEMGLATSFLSGSKEEWSLVRRHPSESTFGVQVAGNKPANLVPAAEAIARECGNNLDFVDLNCGCPIDLVFKSGSGSALLDAASKLGKILVGMNRALGEIPLTVKLRTGIKEGRNVSHNLMPRIASEWNPGCITLHGRTRQQRYSKLADWDYIKECVSAVRAREAEEDLQPIPIFGGGDCFSSQDYWEKVDHSGVDGVMVARGALIKPWIFTEIKERREWDISSRERLELIRRFAEYGLSHFGTDTTGVNTTRRYLCEALSFQYRYVPIGLLERLPSRINDRPPAYRGRDELETLLASPNSQDWVKVSEMFLGPAPDAWDFIPKHRSNAFESQG